MFYVFSRNKNVDGVPFFLQYKHSSKVLLFFILAIGVLEVIIYFLQCVFWY